MGMNTMDMSMDTSITMSITSMESTTTITTKRAA